MPSAQHHRAVLRNAFSAALDRINGRSAVKRALLPSVDDFQAVHLIAVGKAAAAMTQGALDLLSDRLIDGIVVTKHGHLDGLDDQRLQLLEADHPVPGVASLRAGDALISYFNALSADASVLVLISGGASSLVESLPPEIDAEGLQCLSQALLSSGMNIAAINRIRKAISLIKGGKLLCLGKVNDLRVLLISDVQGNDPGAIGSGLFYPEVIELDESDVAALDQDSRKYLYYVSKKQGACQKPIPPHRIVASLDDALSAVAEHLKGKALTVYLHREFLDGEVSQVAEELSTYLTDAPAGFHVWGGETTVVLPEHPGRGGRNQHLGLLLARQLAGRNDVSVLTVGTDGTDGPTSDAGALIDGGTVARGKARGLDIDECLAQFDAGRFLEASGDLVTTGPTGTNVMDLVLASVA